MTIALLTTLLLLLVPASPQHVTVTSRDVTRVALSWQPPQPVYGVITGYSIGYHKTTHADRNDDDSAMVIDEVNSPLVLHYTLTGLQPYTSYQLQVTMLTDYVESATTNIILPHILLMKNCTERFN